jgi:hypothetical protein
MHEYYKIKQSVSDLLFPLGFVEESEDNQSDYYGSIKTIYVSSKNRILLGWDGEEGFGFAEIWENQRWNMLSSMVEESKESVFKNKINELCAELKTKI